MESHRSKKLAGAAQKESAKRDYKLEEIDHLTSGTIARAGEGDLAALLKPAYLANGRKPVIRHSIRGSP